jgi:hypothetical protein
MDVEPYIAFEARADGLIRIRAVALSFARSYGRLLVIHRE